MALLAACRHAHPHALLQPYRFLRTLATSSTQSTATTISPQSELLTHYKITLRRSGISLGSKVQGTLESLGIHKRHQTVYHRHSADIAGKILKVKELVEVENVPESAVRNKWEQRQERKAVRGYKVTSSKWDRFMHV